jgi:multidrug efflux pump subunit AcrA (membrane-fusion protein)
LAIKDEELNQVEKEVGFREKHLATSRDFLARNEKLWAEKLISEVELLQHRLALAESEKDLNVAQRTVQQVTLQRRQLESERARQRTEEEAECEKLKVRLEAMQRQLENCHGALMSIHAPYHGVILSLAHRNAGGVVHEGDELCQLARVEGEPRVRLLVHEAGLPKLAVGQKVRLFFEAFPAQRYGTISGTLKWISPAAVTSGAGQQFTARAALAQTSFRARDGEHPLRVGMKGEARIVVGSRTLVEFALEPIRQLREQVRR